MKLNNLQKRLNITRTIRKYSIDPNLKTTGSEFHSGSIPKINNHGDRDLGEDNGDDSVALTSAQFDIYSQQ